MDLTFGARLRAQRERQQVSLAAIAEETKINLALLEGLERDDLSRWPAGLFRRAYIRAYAQRIGLEPDRALRDFLEVHPDPIAETSPVEAIAQTAAEKRPRTRLGFLIAGLAGLRAQRSSSEKPAPVPSTPDMFANGTVRDSMPGTFPPTVETADAPFNAAAVIEDPTPSHSQELTSNRHIPNQSSHPPTDDLRVEGRDRDESRESDSAPRPVKLVKASAESAVELRRDTRALERNVASLARLCMRIGCTDDDGEITAVLEDAVRILDAQGAIIWIWDADATALWPVLACGYSHEVLVKLPGVARSADNAIAASFRSGQKRVVRGLGRSTGAFVTPLLTPAGCVGVLALEFSNGGEQLDFTQALATILGAQLSTLFAGMPRSAAADEWQQADETLVAS